MKVGDFLVSYLKHNDVINDVIKMPLTIVQMQKGKL